MPYMENENGVVGSSGGLDSCTLIFASIAVRPL